MLGHFYVAVFWCLVWTLLAGSEEAATYTNDWVVRVDHGRAAADAVASRHGFVNLGQISDLENWYHFVHTTSPARSRRSLEHKRLALTSESTVQHAEQQVVKRRVKRGGYSLPTDPLWDAQWYLHGNGQTSGSKGNNMNIEWAWEQGVTGKDVVVTILDDGLEHNHPDLHDNYDPDASFDFNSRDSDPMPRYDPTNENKHGTRCAGEVAAVKNNVCSIGAAYEAKIGGIRMLDGDVTDVVEGSSMSLHSQHIDIYSASWGPDDDGVTVDGPGTLAKSAFTNGVTKGRHGLGSIFMWASGNGGSSGDSCSCDGYVISIHTIAVGAVAERGDKPWYTEQCPATLVVTYSSGSSGEQQIVSSDLHSGCTRRHTGTSASAPLAAGIVALALQVNPSLTWRDVQHLLVLTSRSDPMKQRSSQDWHTNGAGHDVSHLYGFGLMDATAMVNRARHWETVPTQVVCKLGYKSSFNNGNVYTIQVDQSNCDIKYLEHVQAIVSTGITGRRGDISIKLTSPSGYTSQLLQRRSRDYHSKGFSQWPFMSVHHWGEHSQGEWTLTMETSGSTSARLTSCELVLYGTSEQPHSIGRNPRSCDPNCLGSCARPGAQYCDTCAKFQLASNFSCVSECPVGTFQNLHMCRDCVPGCDECSDDSSCDRCHHGYIAASNGSCTQSCPSQTFLNAESGSCDLCDGSCGECSGSSADQCTGCPHGSYYLQDGHCIVNRTCPTGSYFHQLDLSCDECHETCAECNGTGPSDCTRCHPDHSLNGTQCVPEQHCPVGEYYDDVKTSCVPCLDHCLECIDSLSCSKCNSSFFLHLQKAKDADLAHCIAQCPEGWFGSISDGFCSECHESCLACGGPLSHDCITCYPNGSQSVEGACPTVCDDPGMFYDPATTSCQSCMENCFRCPSIDKCTECATGSYMLPNVNVCSPTCTPGYYGDDKFTRCMPCDSSCATCNDGETNNCLSCPEHMLLSEGVCLANCPEKTYSSRVNHSCIPCHFSCLSCLGSKEDNCLSCSSPSVLDGHRCVSGCPNGSVMSDSQCEACPLHCADCSAPRMCTLCSSGYVLYKPEPEKCQKSCPRGHYGNGGVCVQCSSPCNECSSKSRCLTCVPNYRMLNNTCRSCCTEGNTEATNCCHCDLDKEKCLLKSSEKNSSTSFFSMNGTRVAFILLIITMACLVIVAMASVFIYCRIRRNKDTRAYQMLMPRSGDGLPSIGSDSEDEMFTKS